MTNPCLRCGERLRRWRGLCLSCHAKVSRAILAGETTSEAEVAAGRMLPTRRVDPYYGKEVKR